MIKELYAAFPGKLWLIWVGFILKGYSDFIDQMVGMDNDIRFGNEIFLRKFAL